MTLLQKDFAIHRIPANGSGKYEYQLLIKDDPCKAEVSDKVFDFGLVNVRPDGSVIMELSRNSDGILQSDLEDPDTFIIPVTQKE